MLEVLDNIFFLYFFHTLFCSLRVLTIYKIMSCFFLSTANFFLIYDSVFYIVASELKS